MRKVYAVFESRMLMPYMHYNLLDIYENRGDAEAEKDKLNANNDYPMERDDYGPLHGKEYVVREFEVK